MDFLVGGELAAPRSSTAAENGGLRSASDDFKSQQPVGCSSEGWAQVMGRGPENAPAFEW